MYVSIEYLEYSERIVSAGEACIHCLNLGTTCYRSHPTAAQQIIKRRAQALYILAT